MRRLAALLLMLTIFTSGGECSDGGISKAQVEAMFDAMRQNAPWSVDGPLLWGYFFNSSERAQLHSVSDVLASQGYRLVRISERRSLRDSSSSWTLHVERVESHTVDTLHQRNQELDALAREHGLVAYDGMDVGPVPKE